MFDKAFMGCGITVLGDADRIRQIVVNILENAVKFTRTGYIKFLASYEEDTLSVKVKDTGIGMGENTTQRIFQPFERLLLIWIQKASDWDFPLRKGW